MCLYPKSLRDWFNWNREHTPLSDTEIECAISTFERIWKRLDHTRKYCINPHVLAVELLYRSGIKTEHYEVIRRRGAKAAAADDKIVELMWSTAFPINHIDEHLAHG